MIKKFESISREVDINKLSSFYTKEKIDKSESIIYYVKDIISDLRDMTIGDDVEIFSYIDYTPMTWAMRETSPKLFLDIKIYSKNLDDNLIKRIEDIYESVISYLNTEDVRIEKNNLYNSDSILWYLAVYI